MICPVDDRGCVLKVSAFQQFGTPADHDYWRAVEDLGFGQVALLLPTKPLDESLRLLDDTTNDYVTDSSASAVREDKSEAAQIKTVCEEHAAPARCGVDSFSAAFFETKPSPLTGQDLLPLLSIRRT